jgi:hypothetical protein
MRIAPGGNACSEKTSKRIRKMADQATGTAPTETTTATTETIAPVVETTTEATETKAPASAMDRAKAAMEKAGVDKEKPAEDGDKTEPGKEAAKPAEEEKKSVEPRLSRGLAIIAEREERVRKAEAGMKSTRAQFEAEMAPLKEDLQLVRSMREALAKGGKAAALKVLGIDMREGIEELSRSYQEPTAEEIARKVASDEWDSRQKAEQARQEAAQAAKEASDRAQDAASSADFVNRAHVLCVADDVAYAHVISHEVTGEQLWLFTKALSNKLGRAVAPEEALAEAEKILEGKDNQARAKKAAKETAAAEAEKAKKPAEKKASDAKPPEKSAPAKQAQERKNASQRAAEAMRRLNIS